MVAVTINSQYRVTIPKEIREKFDLKPGDRVTFVQEGRTLRMVKVRSIEQVQGMLTLDELSGIREENKEER